MLKIYYGRESADKEAFIYERIKGQTLVIVPDQYTLEAEKKAMECMNVKGLLDVEILGFSRLGDRILAQSGKDGRVLIDKYGRHMLLTGILMSLKDRLQMYRGFEEKNSFAEMVNNAISEIKQNGKDPDELKDIADSLEENSLLKRKLDDISLIYEKYEEAIRDRYTDSEDHGKAVVEGTKSAGFIRETDFWVYGFDTLSPQNMAAVMELCRYGKNVSIVLTYDEECSDSHIFTLTGNLIENLKEQAYRIGAEFQVEKITGYEKKKTEAISHLEKTLYSIPETVSCNHDGIRLVRAGSIHGETETAAVYITGLVRDKGLKYSDIAVICNDLDSYGHIISRIFSRYGIPVFLDRKRKLGASSPVRFMMGAIEAAASGYDSEKIFSMIKSGFTELEDEQIEELENYVIRYRITGSSWKKPFTKGEKEYDLEALDSSREYMYRLIEELYKVFKEDSCVKAKIEALYRFLDEKCHMAEKIEERAMNLLADGDITGAQEVAQVWNITVNLLEQVADLIGDEKYKGEELVRILAAGFEEIEAGVIPPVADSVKAGTSQRSRLGDVKAVVVLGAVEGVMPAGKGKEGLLNDDELKFLEERDIILGRLENIKVKEETLGIYRTLSAPSEYLFIGASNTGADGGQQKPSSIIGNIQRMFPAIKQEVDVISGGNEINLINGREGTLPHLTRALREGMEKGYIEPCFEEALAWYMENDRESIDKIKDGLFFTIEKERISKEKTDQLYKGEDGILSFSPSRLEKYCRCPFSHFITYGLKPQERKVSEMAGREIGNLYHETLMKLSEVLSEAGLPITDSESRWMTIEYEEYESLIDTIIDRAVTEFEEGLLSHSGEEKYRTQRFREIIKYIGWILIDHVRKGQIDAALFEAPFRRGKLLPPVEVDLGDEKVYIEGIIDRLDVLSDGSIKVIDYKSGTEKFSVKEALSGWKLQLMIYLKAGLMYGSEERKPAGAFYFVIEDPMADMSGNPEEVIKEAVKSQLAKNFRLEGAVVNDAEVIKAIAGEFISSSDVISVSISRSGNVTSRKKDCLIDPEDFTAFMEEVYSKVEEACRKIAGGDISIEPKKKDSFMTACTYCQFKAICSFDMSLPQCRYVAL